MQDDSVGRETWNTAIPGSGKRYFSSPKCKVTFTGIQPNSYPGATDGSFEGDEAGAALCGPLISI
jgi:hypothetical protein